jgi:hypothetical protein
VGVGIGKENHQMNFNQFPSSPPHWSVCCAVLPVATHMFVSISLYVWYEKENPRLRSFLCVSWRRMRMSVGGCNEENLIGFRERRIIS